MSVFQNFFHILFVLYVNGVLGLEHIYGTFLSHDWAIIATAVTINVLPIAFTAMSLFGIRFLAVFLSIGNLVFMFITTYIWVAVTHNGDVGLTGEKASNATSGIVFTFALLIFLLNLISQADIIGSGVKRSEQMED